MFFNESLHTIIFSPTFVIENDQGSVGSGEDMRVLIRVADVLSADETFEVSDHRETFEDRVRDQLRKVPVDVAFDWAPIETSPANAFQFFDRNGYPMSVPAHLACLTASLERAIADAASKLLLLMERSPTRAQRWYARAEEYRTIAERAQTAAGRDAYLALAASCLQRAEHLAEFGGLATRPAPGVDADADDSDTAEDAA